MPFKGIKTPVVTDVVIRATAVVDFASTPPRLKGLFVLQKSHESKREENADLVFSRLKNTLVSAALYLLCRYFSLTVFRTG